MLPAEIQKVTWYVEKHNMSQVTFRNTTCYISYAQWINTPSCMLNAHTKNMSHIACRNSMGYNLLVVIH